MDATDNGHFIIKGAQPYQVGSKHLAEAVQEYNDIKPAIDNHGMSWIALLDLKGIAAKDTAGSYDALQYSFYYGFMQGMKYEQEKNKK